MKYFSHFLVISYYFHYNKDKKRNDCMSQTRIPTQKRAKEKREKIILKGFELMCKNGFYNTTTQDIAKYSGVSTGIIYQYFNDKKEIFIEGIKNYSNHIMFPVLEILENTQIEIHDLHELLNNLLEKFVSLHSISKKEHEEMIAMSHLDEDIAKIFSQKDLETTERIIDILKQNQIEIKNAYEKIHLVIGLIENYAHEIVYHHHEQIRYDIMKKELITCIYKIIIE